MLLERIAHGAVIFLRSWEPFEYPFEKAAYTEGEGLEEEADTEKEAFVGGGIGGGYGYGVCPYRCMTSILHARRCMAYFPSCGGDYGWCGYGGGGGGRGGYGDVSACLVLDILILVSCLFKLSH